MALVYLPGGVPENVTAPIYRNRQYMMHDASRLVPLTRAPKLTTHLRSP